LALLLANRQAKEAKTCLKNALKAVPDAGGRYNQCMAMLKIAEAQLALGVTDDAQATLMRAKNTALAAIADDPQGKGQGNPVLLLWIAMAQKKSGDAVAAKSTFERAAKTARNSHVRLREAVESMAGAGLYDLAVRTAHGIKLASPRQAAYQAVARVQGQGGQVKEALVWIKRLEGVEDRAFALSALSLGVKNRIKNRKQ